MPSNIKSCAGQGNQDDRISLDDIHQALNCMFYARNLPGTNRLLRLKLVDFVAENNRMPFHYVREYALQLILSDTIKAQLAHHRLTVGLRPSRISETRDQGCAALQIDVGGDNKELIAWSLLFYRYVRVDLDLGTSRLADITHLSERTIRRHCEHGVRRLMYRLMCLESLLIEENMVLDLPIESGQILAQPMYFALAALPEHILLDAVFGSSATLPDLLSIEH